jgi:protein involved in polysaccharide export with SLBB domain
MAVAAVTAASAQSVSPRAAEELAASLRAGDNAPAPSARAASTLEGAIDPESYVLGPGDLLEVVYRGTSQSPERVRVSPSGRIHLSATGPVLVAGLTLAEGEKRLRKELSRYYGNTGISVDLLEVRTFRVHLLGHVEEPGAVTVSASDRADAVLSPEAKLLPSASLRNLLLRRSDGTEITVELMRYRLLGDLDANPWLQDGDVMVIPAQRDSVSIFGRVARPGFVEYRTGDSLQDLLDLAGGLDAGADTELIELRRFTGGERKQTLSLSEGGGSLTVLPGDGFYIRSRPDWRRVRLVELTGEVRYPGLYAIEKEAETLRSLIVRAGGFTEDADPTGTEVYRPNVFDRPEDDPEFLRLQAIPIQEMTNDEFEYLKLRSRQRQGLASSVLASDLTGGTDRVEDLILRAGDRILIPAQNLAVDVQGAIRAPGFVPYSPDRDAWDYIELAGGKTDRARTGKVRIIRARTGERVKVGGDSAVDPGDLVWVPEKPDRDWWKIMRETAVFLAQIGTLVVIVDSVKN